MVRRETYEVYVVKCPYGVYVGSTKLQLKLRWQLHTADLKKGKHPCKGLQRAYDEGFEMKPERLEIFCSQHKASCIMAERYYQLKYNASGELMNTRIEKEPTGDLCKFGKKFLKQISDLGAQIN